MPEYIKFYDPDEMSDQEEVDFDSEGASAYFCDNPTERDVGENITEIGSSKLGHEFTDYNHIQSLLSPNSILGKPNLSPR